jgi:aspartate-semialdehyde dehydrogenase
MSGLHVAIAGATGAVGADFLRLFEKRNYPISRLTLLASKRSVGKTLRFRGEDLPVAELTQDAFEGVDHAYFSLKLFARIAVAGIGPEFDMYAL